MDFKRRLAEPASGIPGFVHEIGRAAFDVDTDDVLQLDGLAQGIAGTDDVVGAMAMLEEKRFRERYSKKILSKTYRRVLHAMAADADDEVSVEAVRKRLPEVEQVAPYLANMATRGVVVRVEREKGVYRLPDRMFKVVLRMTDTPGRR